MLAHRAIQCVTGLSNLQEINGVNKKEKLSACIVGFICYISVCF